MVHRMTRIIIGRAQRVGGTRREYIELQRTLIARFKM